MKTVELHVLATPTAITLSLGESSLSEERVRSGPSPAAPRVRSSRKWAS